MGKMNKNVFGAVQMTITVSKHHNHDSLSPTHTLTRSSMILFSPPFLAGLAPTAEEDTEEHYEDTQYKYTTHSNQYSLP